MSRTYTSYPPRSYRLGLDPKLLAGIINSSSGRNWSSDTYNPCPGVMANVPASRNYEGGFGSALMLKDVGLAMDAAQASGTAVPIGSLAHQLYGLLCNDEKMARKDFSVIYQYLQAKSKQK